MDQTEDTIGQLVQKLCFKCNESKNIDLFYSEPRNTDGKMGSCKKCILETSRNNYSKTSKLRNQQSAAWAQAHRKTVSNYVIKHRLKFKDRYVDSRLKYMYGITSEDYTRILVEQKGLCAICNSICNTGKQLCVDHNHETGKVRGLLCRSCNSAIGLLKENTGTLLSAIKYIKHGRQ